MKLQITKRTELALRMLQYLKDGERRNSKVIAEAIGSTPGFVAHVAQHVVTPGWVRSDTGPTGGYVLATTLEEISLLALIEASEGPTDDGQCVLSDRACGADRPCALHEPWRRARTSLTDQLAATPLSSLSPSAHRDTGSDHPPHQE